MITDEISRLSSKQRLKFSDLTNSIYHQKFIEISHNLNSTSPRQILFHASNPNYSQPKCRCGNALGWHPDLRSYRSYCSNKCASFDKLIKIKKDNMEKLGVEWHTQLPDWADKVKKTCQKKYGVDSYSKTEAFVNKVKITNNARFGVDHPAQSEQCMKKAIETSIKNHGVSHPNKDPNVRKKIETTCLEKYGETCSLANADVRERGKETCIKKYGVDHPMKNQKHIQRYVESRKKNYYSEETLVKLNDIEWLKQQHQTLSIPEVAKLLGVSASNLVKYYHKYEIEIQYHATTAMERTIQEYFQNKNISIELHNRTILKPKEIDIYFPDFKLGIEINGLYWHSDEFKDSKYHLEKLEKAHQAGIDLWQFSNWEMIEHWELIISKIEHKLGMSEKIHARKLQIGLISDKAKSKFLMHNHIQGNCPSKINIGLFNSTELIMIGTFGRSRFNKKANWELLRMASLQHTAVIGGASKIMKHFNINYMLSNETLISYCHRRFSSGSIYQKLGFTHSHSTVPGYSYVKNGKHAGSRNQWQKHMLANKLEKFNHALSEGENMKLNGFHKIWDCGQSVFVFSKTPILSASVVV